MAYAQFPSSLPEPQPDGFGIVPGDGRRVFRPDSGPPLIRRRFSATVDLIAMTFMLTATQFATLQTFVTDTLGGGTAMFEMTDWLDPAAEKWLVAFAEGGLPALSSVRGPDAYIVTCQVMRFPR